MQFNKYTHTHTHTHTRRATTPERSPLCPHENTYQGRAASVVHTWRATAPERCPLCPREKTHQGTAASVAVHQHQVHPGEGNILFDQLGRPLQRTRRSNQYGVCQKCGDFHTNFSRHSIGCDRTPPETVPPHFDGTGGEPSVRNPATPLTPAAKRSNQSKQSSQSRRLPWGIEAVGPMLDALDGTTLSKMSLSTATVVRQEHRMPFARRLRHTLRIFFCQAHNVLQVAPGGGPNNEALVTNLKRATHITPDLLQSPGRRYSRQGRYNEYTRGELAGLIYWLVIFAGRSWQKAREDAPIAKYEQV